MASNGTTVVITLTFVVIGGREPLVKFENCHSLMCKGKEIMDLADEKQLFSINTNGNLTIYGPDEKTILSFIKSIID